MLGSAEKMLISFVHHAQAGGHVEARRVEHLSELSEFDVVVNCGGLRGAELSGDTSAYPVRGQVIGVQTDGQTDRGRQRPDTASIVPFCSQLKRSARCIPFGNVIMRRCRRGRRICSKTGSKTAD
jgi:hypothetical protein